MNLEETLSEILREIRDLRELVINISNDQNIYQ